MAEITAANVAKLREMTGVGMMDCKKALTEAQGNIDTAVDILRKSGAASAAKKATQDAREHQVRPQRPDGRRRQRRRGGLHPHRRKSWRAGGSRLHEGGHHRKG